MIKQELVFVNQSLRSRDEIIRFIADAADKAGKLADKELFVSKVLEREAEISTSIGHGLAIPHGKTDAAKEPFVSYLGLSESIEWDSTTKDQIRGVFLIGVPQSNTDNLHLKCIAEISKKLINDEFRESLMASGSNESAFELLNSINQKLN